MAATYQAVLHDDRIAWRGEAPRELSPGAAVNVSVTILDEPVAPAMGQGRRMADALERIAQAGTLTSVDAAQWEREIRAERPLPGREE